MSTTRSTRDAHASAPRRLAPALLAALALLSGAASVRAQAALNSAQPFGVLGASTVTNTGATTINGDLGLYPGTSITGTSSLTVNGAIHQTDDVARQAQSDAVKAFNSFAGLPPGKPLSGDLGGQTLTPGVYDFASSALLTGKLNLDFGGNPAAMFLFRIGSALTTAPGSSITESNGGQGANVFFRVGTSATLGTTTAFMGTILADQSVTLNTGATITCGRAIALNGAVTLDNNTVTTACVSANVTATPEPASLVLLGTGLVGLFGAVRRKRTVI